MPLEVWTAIGSALWITIVAGACMLAWIVVQLAVTVWLIGRMSGDQLDMLRGLLSFVVAVGVAGVLANAIFTMGLRFGDAALVFFVVAITFATAMIASAHFYGHRIRQYFVDLKGRRGEAAVSRYLQQCGWDNISNFYARKGGRLTQIDHLVLAGGSIVVVETKNYTVPVYGGAEEAFWKDGSDNHATRWQNPIEQNGWHVAAIASQSDTVPVVGVVVVPSYTEFKSGIPPGVVPIHELDRYLKGIARRRPGDDLSAAVWRNLSSWAGAADLPALRDEHFAQILVSRVDKAGMAPSATAFPPAQCPECQGKNLVVRKGKSYYWHCDSCHVWSQHLPMSDNARLVRERDGIYLEVAGARQLLRASLPRATVRPGLGLVRLPH